MNMYHDRLRVTKGDWMLGWKGKGLVLFVIQHYSRLHPLSLKNGIKDPLVLRPTLTAFLRADK